MFASGRQSWIVRAPCGRRGGLFERLGGLVEGIAVPRHRGAAAVYRRMALVLGLRAGGGDRTAFALAAEPRLRDCARDSCSGGMDSRPLDHADMARCRAGI